MKISSLFFVYTFVVSIVLKPTKDDFYKPPINFESQPLGTILSFRKSPHKLRSIYFPIKVANSWDILVRSEDTNGNALAVLSTIIEPFNADPKKLVAYNIAQDSSNIDCSPTYAILDGADIIANLEAQFEFALFAGATLLSEGYYVITTSFETTANGKSAFTAGRLAGKNILNSIRGALQSKELTGLDDPDVILWGYSGGAQASAWAATLMDVYAPDLRSNIIGATFGGIPRNITETVVATDTGMFAGLIPNGLFGLVNEYPHLEQFFRSQMNETQWSKLKLGSELCLIPSILNFAFENILHPNNGFFPDGFETLKYPDLAYVLDENTLALNQSSEFPTIPIFMYHGIWDQVVPYVNAEKTYDNWCAAGAKSIEYATDLTGGHISELLAGLPAAAIWIKNRFNGVDPVEGCVRSDYLSLLDFPNVSDQLVHLVESLQTEFTGQQIGLKGSKRELIEDESYMNITSLIEENF